jgi:cytochrome c oxidase subunit II
MAPTFTRILAADFWMPPPASDMARGVDALFNFILWVCIFFFVLIAVLMVYFVLRYRHREGVKRDTAVGHSTALELTWTIIPMILVLIMFYFGLTQYLNETTPPPGAREVRVTAQKWSWLFTYENGAMDAELYLPIGKPVRFVLKSNDVIHSLSIPAMRVKKAVVPGRYNELWFTPTQAGDFDIFCAEYCGQSHSQMRSTLHVLPEPEFNQKMNSLLIWWDKDSPIEAGEKFYRTRGCIGCHTVDGARGTGPTFKDLYGATVDLEGGTSVEADEDYVRESIWDPQAKIVKGFTPVMPSFKGQLSQLDVLAITSYFKSISAGYKGDDLEALRQKQPPGSPLTRPTTRPGTVP